MEIDGIFIVLIVLLLSVMVAIFNIYKAKVNSMSYLKGIYLYILMAIIFITLLSKYTSKMSITDSQNITKMIILYFISAFAGLCLIYNDKIFVNHLGLALLCFALSLIIGTIFRDSTNIINALIMTSIVVCIFTFIVFNSNEKQLLNFKSWIPYLTLMLFGIIIVDLVGICTLNITENFSNVMSIITVLVFMGFILADTSKILLKSKNLKCLTHECINYPKESISLLLDYVNIFVNMNKYK
jgi:FtsH-binding integral membrane protein